MSREVSSPPISLVQNRTDDLGASFALLGRKALQPFPQTFTTAPAKHCDLCLKRLLSLPQTSVSFASNACPLCLKRLREKAPSLRIPFLPCSPHRAEGRRYHNSRPRGGVPNTSVQWLYPLVQPLFFPQEQEINCYRKKGWPKWQVFSRRMSNFAQKLERMLLPLFIILHQQENKRKYE